MKILIIVAGTIVSNIINKQYFSNIINSEQLRSIKSSVGTVINEVRKLSVDLVNTSTYTNMFTSSPTNNNTLNNNKNIVEINNNEKMPIIDKFQNNQPLSKNSLKNSRATQIMSTKKIILWKFP